MFTAFKKSCRMEPDQYTCRTLIASLEQTRRGGLQLGTAFWLPPNHAGEHKNVMAWQSRAPPTVYLLPTCRIYVDKSGHISGAEKAVGFPTLGFCSWSCEGFDWLPRLARGVWCLWASESAISERRKFGEQRENIYLILFLKTWCTCLFIVYLIKSMVSLTLMGVNGELAARFPSKEACFGPYNGALAS